MADKKNNDSFDVALYMRLSREDGDKDESDSIVNQRKLLMDYIDKQNNFILFSQYIDDGYSGTSFNRPDFIKMIHDIEKGKVNCVIVKDLSRFGRDYIKSGYYLEEYFIEHNIRFIAVTDNIDSFLRDYDMLMPVKNIFNAQYARDISQKVQSAFKVKQKSGEFIGAFASYGYMKSISDRHKLVIDEYAASIVQRVFNMYLSGYGKMKIAKILNQEGILCPSSYKQVSGENYNNAKKLDKTDYWTYPTIHRMLNNEMYLGNMVQGKTKRRMKGKAKALNSAEWIIVKETHEPIITQDTWDKVQVLLSKGTKQLSLNDNISVFAGFLRCGDCDRAMVKKKMYRKKSNAAINKNKYCYQCGSYTRYGKNYCSSHYIEHDVIEKIIISDLKCIISSIEDLHKMIEDQIKLFTIGKEASEVRRRKIEGEMTKVKRLKREVYEDYKEGLLSKSDYLSFKCEYEVRERLFDKQLIEIESKADDDPYEGIFKSKWINNLLHLKYVENLDRDIVTEMIDNIYIYENNRIKIVYNFSDELESIF